MQATKFRPTQKFAFTTVFLQSIDNNTRLDKCPQFPVLLTFENVGTYSSISMLMLLLTSQEVNDKQESPAVADNPARRESMLKLLQFDDRPVYNDVADNTGLSSFV